MNEVVSGVLRWTLRLVVLALGVVLFLSLLAAGALLAVAWALRAAWARLTGRPVTPWVMRMDPRSGFQTAFRSTQRWSAAGRGAPFSADAAPADPESGSRRGGVLPGAREVTDVQPREVREP